MLTLEKVRHDIEEETNASTRYRNQTDAESKKVYKRHQRTVEHLRELESILISEPSEQWLRSEVDKHEARIQHVLNSDNYKRWRSNNPIEAGKDNAQTIYYKAMGLSDTRRHLKYAREILND